MPYLPYLPPAVLQGAVFPEGYGQDFALAVRLLEEKYKLYFPKLAYETIKVSPTAATSQESIVGVAGTTQFDPLWNEAVDPALAGGTWQQPHLSATTQASIDAVDQFNDPVEMFGRIQRSALDADLKRWGFDRVRDLIVLIPCSLFDRWGATAGAGDRFRWDNDFFTVIQRTLDSFWMNSNTKLFVVLNAEHRRRGS